jgi:alpha-1,6-mannosyltransferase
LAISLLTSAAAVFRSELAILLGTTTLYLLIVRRIPLKDVFWAFAVTFVVSLAVSVPIDSYFWQKPLWPELWGFYFNAILGSSSEWGTSPWHYYFSSALWKLLANPLSLLVLVPFAVSRPGTTQQSQALCLPSLLFLVIYSLQPHKEARFIIYVVPPLTAAAALGANYIFARRAKSALYSLGSLVVVLSVLASFALSTLMLLMSSLNYPGGEALSQLRGLVTATPSATSEFQTVMVHTDVLSCMTGVTLFGQHPYPPTEDRSSTESISFVFDKTEKPATLDDPTFWSRFDYVLAEDPGKVLGSWETVGLVQGLSGVEILQPGQVANGDLESGDAKVLGRGAVVRRIREFTRNLTRGWWAGPRMEPKVRILKRRRSVPRKEVIE